MVRPLFRPLLPLLALGACAGYWAPGVSRQAREQASLSAALTTGLAERGWLTEAEQVQWVDRPLGGLHSLWSGPRAVVLAHRAEEPADVLLVRTTLSPDGRLLSIGHICNLSDTASVDEDQVRLADSHVAWTVRVSDEVIAIHSVDLTRAAGLPRDEFGWLARLQMHVTWLQETGQFAGVQKHEFRVEPPAKKLSYWIDPSGIKGLADTDVFHIGNEGVQAESSRVLDVVSPYGHPGNLVTWAVDRVRAIPWFGSARMQLLKTVTFAALDRLERARGQLTHDDGLASLNDEIGHVLDHTNAWATDPESGFPPENLAPILKDPLPREGQWSKLESDPFIARSSNLPPLFAFAFLRTDQERPYTKVFIVLWDPRHLDLHMMSGTREPKTATGETGPGQVPRDPEIISNFVGAFNGGFQATHGEYGMMADSVVYLPPKPFAATVARLSDGSTGFGTWPNQDEIPENIGSFRQNLTPLIMDGKVNPYQRTWWGGVPPGWEDATRTVRTGLCLTREGFIGYFYGSSIDSIHLASAMQATRCQYGLQLDMNPGHTGFEFYRIGKKGSLPDVGRKLDSQWEARGDVPGDNGWEFMGRRMIRYMNLMHFPRYVRTESRDFFYLTQRRLLPLPAMESRKANAEPGEGKWEPQSVPQGWPPAVATTRIVPDATRPETKISMVTFDAKWLRASRPNEPIETPIASFEPNERVSGAVSMWVDEAGFCLSREAPNAGAKRIASGILGRTQSTRACAAIGEVGGGIWAYAEVASGGDSLRDAPILEAALRHLGALRILYFGRPLNIRLGAAGIQSASHIKLVRAPGPSGIRIFQQTPIVAPSEWMPLQEKRSRYTRKLRPEPAPASPGDAQK